ncbi:hypothetical protein STEG23_033232, partial [Scotinomys teguina]
TILGSPHPETLQNRFWLTKRVSTEGSNQKRRHGRRWNSQSGAAYQDRLLALRLRVHLSSTFLMTLSQKVFTLSSTFYDSSSQKIKGKMFAEMMFVKYSDEKLIMWVLEGEMGNPFSKALQSKADSDDVALECGYTILDLLCMG